MDTSHLRNAIAYVKKQVEVKRRQVLKMADRLAARGDEAGAEAILNKVDEAITIAKICPQFESLEEELKKRDELEQENQCPF
jgi:guanylate kinase